MRRRRSDGEERPTLPSDVGVNESQGSSEHVTGDMTFSPVVGVDFRSEEQNTGVSADEYNLTQLEFGLGGKLSWAALGLDEDEDDHIGFIGNADDEEEVTSGVYLGVVYGIHNLTKDEGINTLGVRMGLFEDSGDAGLLPVIGGALMVEYTSMLGNDKLAGYAEARSDLGLGVEVNADLGVVAPYAGFLFIMSDVEGKTLEDPEDATKTATRNFATLNIGTDINVIPNTTFTVDYASGDLMYDKAYYSDADATYGDTYGNIDSSTAQAGVFTIATKVSF